MNRYSFSLFLIFLIAFGCDIEKKEYPEIISLENESLKVFVATHLGGRLIFFGSPDGENFLQVNEKAWTEKSPFPSSDSLKIPFLGYDGMITWLGPQSDWWTQQEVVPDLKRQKAVWPPDPFIIYGEYRVTALSDSSLTLKGPHSSVSGITMTKKFSLTHNRMDYEVWIENTGRDTVDWDIWTNSRFDVNTAYCIPLNKNNSIRVEDYSENVDDSLQYSTNDDCFNFLLPDTAGLQNRAYKAKAFINGSKGKIIVSGNQEKLIMNFDEVAASDIHPEHGFVEVYVALTSNPSKNLLELEHHSAYQMLAPGEIMKQKQNWILEKTENSLR